MLQPSDEIKAKINIVDLIRDYIPIKPAGINFRSKCPFHNEKTPSMMISPEKQIWHCFGCGKGGDIFSFVMEIEGVDFAGALRILAPKAGVVLSKQNPQKISEKNRILDILNLSRRYYHKVLLESKLAEGANQYLKKRELTDEIIDDWQIGYSPESWEALVKFLQSKGFSEKEIFLAGMSVKSQSRSGYFDRFRGRIMFPINDTNGNTIAFTARVSPEKEAAETMGKYINSPQTLVYDKSKVLFGFDKAKQEIKKKDFAILVEGQMDVITAHQNGWKNVIASSGTAITMEQINLIKRLTNNICLAFDMDKAGEMAADRGIREAMAGEMGIKVIELPEGKDPDECIKSNLSGWQKAVEEAKPMMQYYFDKTLAKINYKKIEDKQSAAKILLPIIAKLGNRVELNYWLKELGNKLDVGEAILRETISDFLNKKPKIYNEQRIEKTPFIKKTTREEKLSSLLLAILLKFNPLIEYAQNNLNFEYINGEENRSLYKNLLFYYNNFTNNELNSSTGEGIETINFSKFRDWIASNDNLSVPSDREDFLSSQSLISALDVLAILGDEEYYNKEFSDAKEQMLKIVASLEKSYLTQKMKDLAKMIEEAERLKEKEKVEALMHEFKLLSDELKNINIS